MPLPPVNHLRQFLLFAFALIIPCFALWTLVAGVISMPAVGLTSLTLQAWFPDVVDGLLFRGSDAVLMTHFGELNGGPVPPEQSEYQLGFRVNPSILSYSLPFYAALHFATQKDEYLGSFVVGLFVLYPLILVGLISLCLKELMVNLGSLFFEQQGVLVPNPTFIALFYQLNVLIVPTVAPIVLWAWQSRDTQLVRGILNLGPAPEEAESL
ncbi:MAG: exosortase H-associated membrane protein [Halioglobus sp.]